MNRAERRRQAKLTGSSVAKDPIISMKKSDIDRIKREAAEEATETAMVYFLLENLWENYMQSGKVNPIAGIFLGKNNYGYQDKTEYVLTPNQQNDNDYSADEIRERYIASDQQKRLSASNSDEDTSD